MTSTWLTDPPGDWQVSDRAWPCALSRLPNWPTEIFACRHRLQDPNDRPGREKNQAADMVRRNVPRGSRFDRDLCAGTPPDKSASGRSRRRTTGGPWGSCWSTTSRTRRASRTSRTGSGTSRRTRRPTSRRCSWGTSASWRRSGRCRRSGANSWPSSTALSSSRPARKRAYASRRPSSP